MQVAEIYLSMRDRNQGPRNKLGTGHDNGLVAVFAWAQGQLPRPPPPFLKQTQGGSSGNHFANQRECPIRRTRWALPITTSEF